MPSVLNRFGPLERRILFVAAASVLPIAILACAVLIFSAIDQKQRLLKAHEQTMLALVTAVDGELRSSISTLQAFAARPHLSSGDFVSLHGEARLLLAEQPTWINALAHTRWMASRDCKSKIAGSAYYCVAMSGYGSAADKERGIVAGFDEYLVKPVDMTALQLAIQLRTPCVGLV